ncbi:hypothetical protein MATL_G00169120 [Megalops atlanticus]|uniref:SH2 domain-containing protein n=1 Tax=Megalops atlanticus TaxID=7932 RepID=A0A9D3T315_MEGAT|nr:hypothetical protein MATL_G00169120 [Megalops atlanticus]
MSFDNVPSKSEVLSWNAHHLADYLKRLELAGCDKVVMRCSMNGSRFLNMSNNDLQKFPKIHAPMITKLCHEINRTEQKSGFFHKKSAPKHQQQGFVQEEQGWDSEEFEQSDHDYESPESGKDDGSDGDYESPIENLTDEEEGGDEYELPPSEPSDDIPRHFRPVRPVGDGDYIDAIQSRDDDRANSCERSAPAPLQRPGPGPPLPAFSSACVPRPSSPSCEQLSQRSVRPSAKSPPAPSGSMAPLVDRSKKPSFSLKAPCPGGQPGGTGDKSPRPSRRPIAQDHENNHSKTERLDPQWYVGQVTREQADSYLRRVKKDGTFLVRDSSKGSTTQPYTLMVLYQGKVYNIQIRYDPDQGVFSLGTGLKGSESFPGVTEIVQHHMRTPLLLIDRKEQGSGPQKQCALLYPARR